MKHIWNYIMLLYRRKELWQISKDNDHLQIPFEEKGEGKLKQVLCYHWYSFWVYVDDSKISSNSTGKLERILTQFSIFNKIVMFFNGALYCYR